MGIAHRFAFRKALGSNGTHGAQRMVQILLIAAIVLDIALIALLFRPRNASVAERQARYEQSRARFNETSATVRQMRDLKTKLESAIKKDQEFADGHFVRRREAFSTMITNLEALATKNKLRASTVNYALKEEKEQPGYVQVSVKMSVDGSYADLIQFVNSLEKSDLYWLIDGMQVNTGRNNNEIGMALSMQTVAVLPGQKSEL